jgi:effector-binding domain-containing protein
VSDDRPRLETRDGQPTLAIQHTLSRDRLDLGEAYGSTFPRVFAALAERGLAPAGPPFGRYLEWGAERVVVEIGVPVAEQLVDVPADASAGELCSSALPGGTVATLTHVGHYEGLPDANRALAEWIEQRGLERSGALWESYVDDPESVPPDELRTEIVQPVHAPAA